jgi:hypothetical protein
MQSAEAVFAADEFRKEHFNRVNGSGVRKQLSPRLTGVAAKGGCSAISKEHHGGNSGIQIQKALRGIRPKGRDQQPPINQLDIHAWRSRIFRSPTDQANCFA